MPIELLYPISYVAGHTTQAKETLVASYICDQKIVKCVGMCHILM